jgi:hypothetical protein
MLSEQLERGLKKVHVQTQIPVEICKCLARDCPRMPRVTDETSNHRSILLLDPRLIVLSIWPGPCEDHFLLITKGYNRFVDERAIVVGIDAQKGGGGIRPRNTESPSTTSDCSRSSSGVASVQPDATSVITRLWMNEPVSVPPH